MITFDEPYLGKISKKDSKFGKIITLKNVKINQNKKLTIDSDIAQMMEIVIDQNETLVKIYAKDSFSLNASKTIDNYGLRIRVKPFNIQPIKEKTYEYETKTEYDITSSFLKVIAVLAFLILILYLLKKWLTAPKSEGWLFNKKATGIKEIKVINQKILDTKNRVCVIEYEGSEYLTILGTSNILLDKKPKNPKSQFDQQLDQSSDQLVSILKSK
jgi:flagellar biogenesis protein FliO